MAIPFRVAKQYFETAARDARQKTISSPVNQPGRRRYEMEICPKEQRAALQAAFELMKESATTKTEKEQVSEARIVMQGFRGAPLDSPVAQVCDALHMSGRKRRIKRDMIQRYRG